MFLATITLLSAFIAGVYSTVPEGECPVPKDTKPPKMDSTDDFTKTRWNSDKLSPEKSEMAFHAMVWKLCKDKNGPLEFYIMQESTKNGSQCPELQETYIAAITSAYEHDVKGETIGSQKWWEKLVVICNQSDQERGKKLGYMTVEFSQLFKRKCCENTEMEPRHVCCKEMDSLINKCADMMDYCECEGCCPKGLMGDTFSGRKCETLGVKKDPIKCNPEAKLSPKPGMMG